MCFCTLQYNELLPEPSILTVLVWIRMILSSESMNVQAAAESVLVVLNHWRRPATNLQRQLAALLADTSGAVAEVAGTAQGHSLDPDNTTSNAMNFRNLQNTPSTLISRKALQSARIFL